MPFHRVIPNGESSPRSVGHISLQSLHSCSWGASNLADCRRSSHKTMRNCRVENHHATVEVLIVVSHLGHLKRRARFTHSMGASLVYTLSIRLSGCSSGFANFTRLPWFNDWLTKRADDAKCRFHVTQPEYRVIWQFLRMSLAGKPRNPSARPQACR